MTQPAPLPDAPGTLSAGLPPPAASINPPAGAKSKSIKPKYAAAPFNAHPEKWLLSLPQEELCLEDLGGVFDTPAPELLVAIVTSRKALEPLALLLVDANEPTGSGSTLMGWLMELSDTVIWKRSTSALDRLSFALERPFNQAVYQILKGRYSEQRINTTHFSALFCYSRHIEYDSGLGCFFMYNGGGAWLPVSEERIRAELIYFMAPYSRNNMELYNPKMETYREILYHAKAIALHSPVTWRNRHLLCALNAVISVSTSNENLEVFSHSPAYKLRNQIPVNYDKLKTVAPKFEKWMSQVLSVEDVTLFQYWCGMVLLKINPLHVILVVSGEGGAGKSTLLNLLEKLIGPDNVATLSTERLEERFEMSEFLNKSLLLGKDVSANFLSKDSAHVLKSLSGDTGMKAEVKFSQQRVRLGGPYNICVISNSKLRVRLEGDEAAWRRRLWVLDFKPRPKEAPKDGPKDGPKTEKPKQIDKFDELLFEKEGPAILNWMLRGVLDLMKNLRMHKKITLTQEQDARLDAMFSEPGGIDEFIATQVIPEPAGMLTTDDLYSRYEKYCYKRGAEPIRHTIFVRRIGIPLFKIYKAEHGNVQKPGEAIRKGYRGIKLIPEPKLGEHAQAPSEATESAAAPAVPPAPADKS
ncbi:MAG: DUF5906 domain-containing protein [Opitutaceae bacterium]|jgi:phage/plasmid-associated DNA primase